MQDLTLQTLLIRIAVLLPIAALYGFVLCGGARLLGDDGPSHDGRLTLNPFVHIDIIGALTFIAFGFGWITPLAITASALRGGIAGLIGIVLAASLALLAMAAVAVLALPLAGGLQSLSGAQTAALLLAALCRLGVGFALFNLIPVPPLSGEYVLNALLPRAGAWLGRRGLIMGLVLAAILATGVPGRLLDPAIAGLTGLISRDSAMLLRGA